jgi:hypothetical protein
MPKYVHVTRKVYCAYFVDGEYRIYLTRLRNGVKNELFYSISFLLSSSQASDIIKWCRLKDPWIIMYKLSIIYYLIE